MMVVLGLVLVLVPTGCRQWVSISPEQRDRAVRFDRFWNVVHREYPFLDGDGVSWVEMRDRYRPQAIEAQSELAFYRTLWMLAGHLRDGHVSVEAPQEVYDQGNWADQGLGILRAYDNSAGNGVGYYVVSWPQGQAPPVPPGLDPLSEVPELLEIEGVPYNHTTASNKLFLAEPGHGVELLLRWGDGTRTRHVLVAPVKDVAPNDDFDGSMPEAVEIDGREFTIVRDGARYLLLRDWIQQYLHRNEDEHVVLSDGRRVTVARFRSLSLSIKDSEGIRDRSHHDILAERAAAHALALLRPQEGLGADVLLLDLRENAGGNTSGVRGILGALLEPRAALLLSTRGRVWYREQLGGAANGPPIVVLVNARTTSGSELVASALQSLGGAVVVGAPTPGMVGAVYSPFKPPKSDTGIRLPIAQTSIAGVPSVQRRGVLPDVPVLPTLSELRALRAATADAPDPGRALTAIHGYRNMDRWDRAIARGVELALQRQGGQPRDP